MNAQLLEQARASYRAGDFSAAAQMFAAAKAPGEVSGEADHLRGNSLMRLGLYAQAADAYQDALADAAYGKRGALLTNQGKAKLAAGDTAGAVASFQAATQDSSYATPYKAYTGLGEALLKTGNPTDAGVAFRQAAIDGSNPAPAAALCSLGECFIAISRPADAVEAYRTALDFAGPKDDKRAINAGLGAACAAAGKAADAVDAFGSAVSDGTYRLSADQQAAYQKAQDALSAQRSMSAPAGPTGTGAYRPAEAPVTEVDPLDPMGKTGGFMPDPSDTGFFTLTENEMIQQDKKERKIRRKHRHTGLKVFIVLLLILIAAGGGLAFAFTRGLGYPSQQDTLTGLFDAVTNGTDTNGYLASNLDDTAKAALVSSVPDNATATIEGMDQSMTQSTATVKAALSKGGSQTYEVTFVREGIGWKVSALTIDFGNASGDAASTDGSAATTDSAAADGTTSGDASASTATDSATTDNGQGGTTDSASADTTAQTATE